MPYTKLHSKADRGGDEESTQAYGFSTSRSMTRRQQRYANEGGLVLDEQGVMSAATIPLPLGEDIQVKGSDVFYI